MHITLGLTPGGGEVMDFEGKGARERWDGDVSSVEGRLLSSVTGNSDALFACAEATNSAGGTTRVCSDKAIPWDVEPPTVTDMWVWHTGVEEYTQPSCHDGEETWSDGMAGCIGLGFDLKQNSSTEARFQVAIVDEPQSAGTAIGKVLYAISSTQLDVPDASFEDLGHGKELEELGQHAAKRLTVHMSDLQLVSGVTYWLHVWACDVVSNCAMTVGYPIYVDLTVPPMPSFIYPDVHRPSLNLSFWTSLDELSPAWPEMDKLENPWGTPDCQTTGEWQAFHIVDGKYEALTPPQVMGPTILGGAWGHIYLNRCSSCGNLVNGDRYLVRLRKQNCAGSASFKWSEPITLDYTHPICDPPKFSPITPHRDDSIVLSCSQGGRCDRGLEGGYTWLGANATGLTLELSSKTCTDPESGIVAYTLGVGANHMGLNDVREAMPIIPTYGSGVDVWFEDIFSGMQPDQEEVYFLNVICTNGGNFQTHCNNQALKFRIDTSPPLCSAEAAKWDTEEERGVECLHRRACSPYVQSSDSTLFISFARALLDKETHISAATYTLEQAPPLNVAGRWCGGTRAVACGQRMASEGEAPYVHIPLTQLGTEASIRTTLMNLDLKHAHYYRVLALATNGVGLVAEVPCPSPWILVDTSPPAQGFVRLVQNIELMTHGNPPPAAYVWNHETLYIKIGGWEEYRKSANQSRASPLSTCCPQSQHWQYLSHPSLCFSIPVPPVLSQAWRSTIAQLRQQMVSPLWKRCMLHR